MIETEFKVEGLEPIIAKLKEIGGKQAINMVRGGVRAGAAVIRNEAKALVPVEQGGKHPGALKKSIRISSRVRGGQVQISVKAGNKEAYYAHIVEQGSVAHKIKPNKNGHLMINGKVITGPVMHHGAKPHPFMRLAFDKKFHAAMDAMRDYIAKRIKKYETTSK